MKKKQENTEKIKELKLTILKQNSKRKGIKKEIARILTKLKEVKNNGYLP